MLLDPTPAPVSAVNLKDWQREIRDARLAILDAVARLGQAVGMLEAERQVAASAAAGTLPEHLQALALKANARSGKDRALSAATLRSWRRIHKNHGPDGLAPKAPETTKPAPAWLGHFLKLYRRPTKPSVRQCYEDLQSSGVLPEGALPALRTVEREIKRLGAVVLNKGRMGPRELKKLQAYTKRSFDDMDPGDCFTADGHKADIEVQHPEHGQPVRPEIISVLDVATRRCVGWSAELHESSWLVADAIRHSVEQAGIPALFYVDNGCGFRNQVLGGPALGMLVRLGTSPTHSIAYNSQARGVIERFNGSCWVRSAKQLPTYMRRDMDPEAKQRVFKRTRAEISERGISSVMLSWKEFMDWAQTKVDAYNARPHTSLPRITDPETGRTRNMTPNERWVQLVAQGAEIFKPSQVELDDLFRPYVLRTCRRCTVAVFGNSYFSPALDLHHEREVQVGYDIHDASRVWVRDLDGKIICTAGLDANAKPYFPKPVIEQAREKRAAAQLKRLERKEATVLAAVGKPALEASPAAVTLTPSQQAAQAELVREFEQAQATPGRQEPKRDLKRERFLRALRLEDLLARGEEIPETDARWLAGYRTTPEYLSMRDLYENFGPAAVGV
ncbi:Mu transposase C-terminal domain-containing protein [Desulfocurvibacter africanus]|uniref:Mu transposase C-terminal domain-containing protein n=1 Tax=Desulfocurvibacter africanus TaxID=873 RepID=UPI0002E98DE7|nr:Mu transposase C-terminal domain-containing protein [Desulfocurvibacter africanus]